MKATQSNGQIITFYSYKGGTGRTMALANVAALLAEQTQGRNDGGILMIDWDLEAPSLHRFFENLRNSADSEPSNSYSNFYRTMNEHPGVIDLFSKINDVLGNKEPGSEKHWLEFFDEIRISDYILDTEISALHLMKAGRFDGKYPSLVNAFQWEQLYNRAPALFRSFAEYLARKYRYVLVDSRTGLNDTSGICTMLLPEKLVVVFTPNIQSVSGAIDLVEKAATYRLRSDDLRPFIVFPLPSRIERAEPTLYESWRNGSKEKRIVGYQSLFEELFARIYFSKEGGGAIQRHCNLTKYFNSVLIQHIPAYAYGEPVAVLIEKNEDRLSLTESYQVFTSRLINNALPWEDLRAMPKEKIEKEEVFLNPYHFVPVKGSGSTNDLLVSNFPTSANHIRHDRYQENTFSGRIICRLTTITPTFVGDKEIEPVTDKAPKRVSPFRLDGKPAIPSTSLRGMISSIAEAASNSALRILDDARYSYRKPFSSMDERLQPLSAIGMVIFINGKPELRPLTLPTIEFQQGRPIQLQRHWVRFFKRPNLKVYFGNARSIRHGDFDFETFRRDDKQFYYMKLPAVGWLNNQPGVIDPRAQGLNSKGRQRRFLVSLFANSNEVPKRLEEIPPDQRNRYTRGILRVLGCYEKRDQIPHGKKHEIFIPYPEEAEAWPTFPIPADVVDRFYELADQRTDDSGDEPLPFHPRGTERNNNPAKYGKKFRLKSGDLVYFRVEDAPGGARIAEIALSSIWRGRVEERLKGRLQSAGTHRFFEAINPNLVPLKATRTMISVAEQMFGFIEEGKEDERKSGRALAGRIYFSHALYVGLRRAYSQEWENTSVSPYKTETTLKILGSPKPPSPALYFKLANRGGYISKGELSPGKHHSQGRKFYLHHRQSDIASKPWRTAKDKEKENCLQKVRIEPVKSRAVFYFHIDFDNLSPHEVGLLLYALQPSEQFRHKIGMGKPLGLGSIHIEPIGFFSIDRQARYSASGLFTEDGQAASRYHQIWVADGEDRSQWPAYYEREKSALGEALNINFLHDEFARSMDPDIKQALELLGDPNKVTHRVHAPLTEDNQDEETETFKWFVANDQASGQGREKTSRQREYLEPLTKDTTDLPTLSIHPRKN